MALTPAQLATLKAAINADPVLSLLPNNDDSAFQIAEEFNKTGVPDSTVWRSDVGSEEIGNAWVGTDIDSMSALNMQRLQLLLASAPQGKYDMGRADRRAGFESPFGTNVNNASRVAMRAAWKRLARRVEVLYAVGSGTVASPSTMGYEGPVSLGEVKQARSF